MGGSMYQKPGVKPGLLLLIPSGDIDAFSHLYIPGVKPGLLLLIPSGDIDAFFHLYIPGVKPGLLLLIPGDIRYSRFTSIGMRCV